MLGIWVTMRDGVRRSSMDSRAGRKPGLGDLTYEAVFFLASRLENMENIIDRISVDAAISRWKWHENSAVCQGTNEHLWVSSGIPNRG